MKSRSMVGELLVFALSVPIGVLAAFQFEAFRHPDAWYRPMLAILLLLGALLLELAFIFLVDSILPPIVGLGIGISFRIDVSQLEWSTVLRGHLIEASLEFSGAYRALLLNYALAAAAFATFIVVRAWWSNRDS